MENDYHSASWYLCVPEVTMALAHDKAVAVHYVTCHEGQSVEEIAFLLTERIFMHLFMFKKY
jgi:hypothetical protein